MKIGHVLVDVSENMPIFHDGTPLAALQIQSSGKESRGNYIALIFSDKWPHKDAYGTSAVSDTDGLKKHLDHYPSHWIMVNGYEIHGAEIMRNDFGAWLEVF